MKLQILLTLTFIVAPATVPAQEKLVPYELISDDVAWTALFFVIADAPPPHWDHQTSLNWLAQRGFAEGDAERLIRAATRFYDQYRKVDLRLAEFNVETRKSLSPDVQTRRAAIELERKKLIEATVQDVHVNVSALLRQKVTDLFISVKKDIRMKAH